MIPVPFSKDIVRGHLDTLVEEKVREGKRLDYKRELPEGNDKAKKETLADVTAFAKPLHSIAT